MIEGMGEEQQAISDAKLLTSQSMRRLMLALGLVCTAVGVIGLILPVMPGTVFLLIAAWAFSRSSERLHLWLFHHPRFGQSIRDWHRYRVIPIKAKAMAIAMMAASFAYVATIHADQWLIPVLVGATIVPVAVWVATRPSRVPAPAQVRSRDVS